MLAGKPLIEWTLDAVRHVSDISEVFVSTDDEEVAGIARSAGVQVPWLRPAALASDDADSADVATHFLDWYSANRADLDGLIFLQPTSPFRTAETIKRGIELFRLHGRSVVSVSRAHTHPMWCFRADGDTMVPYVQGDGMLLRSQDLPPAYVLDGAMYLFAPDRLRLLGTFWDPEAVPLIIDDWRESVDIDTESDWEKAEAIARDLLHRA